MLSGCAAVCLGLRVRAAAHSARVALCGVVHVRKRPALAPPPTGAQRAAAGAPPARHRQGAGVRGGGCTAGDGGAGAQRGSAEADQGALCRAASGAGGDAAALAAGGRCVGLQAGCSHLLAPALGASRWLVQRVESQPLKPLITPLDPLQMPPASSLCRRRCTLRALRRTRRRWLRRGPTSAPARGARAGRRRRRPGRTRTQTPLRWRPRTMQRPRAVRRRFVLSPSTIKAVVGLILPAPVKYASKLA